MVTAYNDLLMQSDLACSSILILLDMSATFDTVDYNILLDRLWNYVGWAQAALS